MPGRHAAQGGRLPASRRRSAGYSTRLLNGISSITSAGFSACICAGSNQPGLVMPPAWSTQVDAFWSNSDQNGVTSANTTSSAARPPRRRPPRRGGCRAPRRAASRSPTPPNASTTTSARQTDATNPSCGIRASEREGPDCAGDRPRAAWPPGELRSAVDATAEERVRIGRGSAARARSGSRPSQKITVAINIRTPGMPNATAGPR